jgi:hypothetical protein
VEPIAYDDEFRRDFETRFGKQKDTKYETYGPAYQYGYRMASDERYREKRWDEVESTLRADYERTNAGSKWEQFKDAVRHGWDKATRRKCKRACPDVRTRNGATPTMAPQWPAADNKRGRAKTRDDAPGVLCLTAVKPARQHGLWRRAAAHVMEVRCLCPAGSVQRRRRLSDRGNVASDLQLNIAVMGWL